MTSYGAGYILSENNTNVKGIYYTTRSCTIGKKKTTTTKKKKKKHPYNT